MLVSLLKPNKSGVCFFPDDIVTLPLSNYITKHVSVMFKTNVIPASS